MNQLTDVIHLRSPYGAKSSEYEVEFDPELRVIWAFLNPRGNACFTPTLLAAIRNHDDPFISEIFDLREKVYPDKSGGYELWESFKKE